LNVLQVYVGYDPREAVAFHTLAHSIQRRSSIPVMIAPVMQSQLKGIYTRPRGSTESTEFSLTRFLVPALSQVPRPGADQVSAQELVERDAVQQCPLPRAHARVRQ
jgi:hypothetical protein